MTPSRWRAAAQAVPVVLAIATVAALFAGSDVNAALLWSQCHARSRLPHLGGVPLLGTPLCFLVGFVRATLASLRAVAVVAVVLAGLGGLVTVCVVEAARPWNRRSVVIARPAPVWMLFVVGAGALVWQLLVAPAFIRRASRWRDPVTPAAAVAPSSHGGVGHEDRDDEDDADCDRSVLDAEIVAIPVAVAVGFYLPSILMLASVAPAIICVWLFFPLYVSLLRQMLRWGIRRLRRSEPSAVILERRAWRLALVYAVPVICSILAQAFLIGSMTVRDGRKETTRSALRLFEINALFTALTVLFWVFVEVGWQAPLVMAATSVVLGPGAGVCLGWCYREKLIQAELDQRATPGRIVEADTRDVLSHERTPLLP